MSCIRKHLQFELFYLPHKSQFSVFKVYQIEEDKFKELCNLRTLKHLNLNFSCNDVAWSTTDGNPVFMTDFCNNKIKLSISRSLCGYGGHKWSRVRLELDQNGQGNARTRLPRPQAYRQ